MARPKKPNPRSKLALLTDTEQHALYEFLRGNSYAQGQAWLAKKGINVPISLLVRWWSRYASAFVLGQFQAHQSSLGEEMKSAGMPVTQERLDELTMKYFQRQSLLNERPDVCLRFYTERKKLEIAERTLALQEQKFDYLKRVEEESRKALEAGGTEAELITRWKQILNFSEES